MSKNLRPVHMDTPRSPALRPSVLPTIDRLTGRLFKALVGIVVLGTTAALIAAAYQVLSRN